MPIYTRSNGEQIETETMAQNHLERALAKAERDNDEDNIAALEAEFAAREESN